MEERKVRWKEGRLEEWKVIWKEGRKEGREEGKDGVRDRQTERWGRDRERRGRMNNPL